MKPIHSSIEPLESRIAPAVFAVTTLAANGPGSLQSEIFLADIHGTGADTIIFDHVVHGKTVPLTGTIKLQTSDLTEITDGLTIIGPVPGSSGGIVINGNKRGLFDIQSPTGPVALNDLTITNGASESGSGLYINGNGQTLTLTDCTITGNHAVGASGGGAIYGGGIAAKNAVVVIQNSRITGNTAVGGNGNASSHGGGYAAGGGISCATGKLIILNSIVSGNTVTGGNGAPGTGGAGGQAAGGGVNSYGVSTTIEGSVISGNKVIGGMGTAAAAGSTGAAGAPGANGGTGGTGGKGGDGGEVVGGGVRTIHGSLLEIISSTISGNAAIPGNGGAGGAGGQGGKGGSGTGEPHAGAGGNGGTGGDGGSAGNGYGAGVASYSGGETMSVTIQTSTISGNYTVAGKASAGGKGGSPGSGSYVTAGLNHHGVNGGYGVGGPAGAGRGGAIWAGIFGSGSESLTLSQVTIAQNRATDGGGVYLHQATAAINNCTISQNTATGAGGGLMIAAGSVGVTSTIIAGNTAFIAPDLNGGISDSHDFIGIVTAFGDLINGAVNDVYGTAGAPLNPLLGPLGLHDGGTTATMLLSFQSPAIGDGSNPNSLTTDQNGNPREIGGLTDMGAVEEG